MGISVTNQEYARVQQALADILAEYGVINQSDGKLRYLAAKALLYPNHHNLQDMLSKQKEDDPSLQPKETLSIDLFRHLSISNLARYKLDGHARCSKCALTLPKSAFNAIPRTSISVNNEELHTDIQCPDCGSLALPLENMLTGSVVDKLYHDKTLDMSHAHAMAFAKSFIHDNKVLSNDVYNNLLAKSRLFYLDVLYHVKVMNNRKNADNTFIAGVNTFVASVSEGRLEPDETPNDLFDKMISRCNENQQEDMRDYLLDAAYVLLPENAFEPDIIR